MAGYDGYSMSNNARSAYAAGEKPLSKWTKTEILAAVHEIAEGNELNIDVDLLSKVSASVLRSEFLVKSSWHHTSKFYNCTDFYSLCEEKILDLTDAEILRLSKIHTKSEKPKKSAEEKEITEKAKKIYDKLNTIYLSNITKLKGFGGVVRRWTSGQMDLEKAYADALKAIKQREVTKINQWRRLPVDHWRQESVKYFDNNIETYVAKELVGNVTRNRKVLEQIKVAISELL